MVMAIGHFCILHSKIVLDPIFNLFFVSSLLDIALEVLALDQIRDIILLIVLLALSTALALLHVLVALGKLAQRRETVGAQLVQDTGDQLGEFLLLTVTVQSEGVGGDGGVHFLSKKKKKIIHVSIARDSKFDKRRRRRQRERDEGMYLAEHQSG